MKKKLRKKWYVKWFAKLNRKLKSKQSRYLVCTASLLLLILASPIITIASHGSDRHTTDSAGQGKGQNTSFGTPVKNIATLPQNSKLNAYKPMPTIPTAAAQSANPAKIYGIAGGGGWSNYSAGELNSRLNGLSDLNAKWLRVDLPWSFVQQGGPQSYNWGEFDKVVKAANEHGVRLLVILDYAPAWARSASCSGSQYCQPADPNAFATFAANAAKRYAPLGVKNWEIWNEQNTTRFWNPAPSPTAYANLLKATYPAIKAVSPDSTVILGGMSSEQAPATDINPRTFLSMVYIAGGKNYFDAVGFHPYSFPALASSNVSWNPWQLMANSPVSLESIMSDNGDAAKKIWVTEYGAPTDGPKQVGDVNNFNFANHPDHVTEALQDVIMRDAVQQYQASPYLGAFFWYTYKNHGTDPNSNENFFGLVRGDNTHKPAYDTYKFLINQ